jgi:hypothetical protein
MANGVNLNSVITDSESQLLDSASEPFEIADAGCGETMRGGQNPHRGGFVERSDIGRGLIGPRDTLHTGAR